MDVEKRLKVIKRKTVSSPVHLKAVLDECFEKPERGTTDVLPRAFCWFAFMGIREKDALLIKQGDIDFLKRTVTVGNKTFSIYSEGFEEIYVAANAKTLIIQHVDKKDGEKSLRKDEVRERRDPDRVLSLTDRKASSRYSYTRNGEEVTALEKDAIILRNSLWKKSNDIKLTYSGIASSGLFYRTYELERIGIEPDFYEYASEKVLEAVEDGTHSGKFIPTRTYQIRKQCKTDYELWKRVYSV